MVTIMIKKAAVLSLGLVLVGCAVQKQQMPLDVYQKLAVREALADKCVSLGFMDFQTAASAKNFDARDLNSWAYDPVIYQTYFSKTSEAMQSTPVDKSICDRYSVSIAQRQQQEQTAYQQQQLAAQQQQAYSQTMQAIQNAAPKTTYCNKIGWQTVCNTY
ncbi:Uncharacterised protein [Raoultella terrigena]|uniref:Lipoprotein n=2 Tax=Klebsiella/Raoultella group TaxID=2890311 RepID=A0A4U9D741_RAOTE|nr:Uncharacterised protein [Raoultella terrigena]